MLRIHQNTRPADAKRYYCTSGYYTEGHELEMVGNWGGIAADRLGLRGPVDQASFDRLCDNRDPVTGTQLTPRLRGDRTVGYDFNFNAPKSVSLLYAMYQDTAILDVFRSAVRETMEEIESEAKTRVRRGKQDSDRVTGNLVWSEFVHFTARPVDGKADPSLHAHCFTFNTTFDQEEGRWKAAQFRDLKRDAPYWEAAFHSRLALGLRHLGYGIERHGRDWDIAGLAPELLHKFSRRTQLIEDAARAHSVTRPEVKAQLGAKTRERKQKELGWDDLRAWWKAQLTDGEREQIETVRERARPTERGVTPAAAMEHALQQSLERQSVVSEKRLLAQTLRYGVGEVSIDAAKNELNGHGILRRQRDGQAMTTTRDVLGEERDMLAFARDGRGACRPLAPQHVIERKWLNSEQQAAVRHILDSTDRVMLIRGVAGTGKTTLMQEAVKAIEDAGKSLVVIAPTAQASRGVLRAEGFAQAETAEKLLTDPALHSQLRNGVLWLDEAGLAGTRDMARLFSLAAEKNARVVVMGDSRQHHAVARGLALHLLETQAGLQAVEVKDIRRQQGSYKAAVAALAEGNALEGFDRLDALGWIYESPNGDAHQRLAKDYADAIKRGEQVLVVSPTHKEGAQTVDAIRSELKARKMLGKDERQFERLVPLNLTEAERADPATYRGFDSPMIVQFVQNAPGFQRGARGRLTGVVGNSVHIELQNGSEVVLPLSQARKFQVYRPDILTLAAGDKVRITQNSYSADQHRLNNGAVYGVAGFTADGGIRLDNGWQVPQDFGHFANGLVVTSHASQGKTVDRVLIAQSAESLPATGREQLYVSASRAKKQAAIYTDDKLALREAVTRSEERLSATELVQARPWPLDRLKKHVAHLQRMAARGQAYASRLIDNVRDNVVEHVKGRELAYER
ncbi:MAG: MobF family relaxase [Gemmataceae bacterium]